jgi:hypothetical protein
MLRSSVRHVNFGATLSGYTGCVATLFSLGLMIGVAWLVHFDPFVLGATALTGLIFLGLSASRIGVVYDVETGRVTVRHRYWPLRARTVHEFEVSQIKTFGMVKVADSDESLGDRYAFFMMDGSTVELRETGSNVLDLKVVDQVNLMLGTL